MTSEPPDVRSILRARAAELRERLRVLAGADSAPDAGSDAALLVEVLCGAPTEAAYSRFETSARELAAQGGHLDARLAGIERWATALAQTVAQVLADDPALQAEAQAIVSEAAGRAAVAVARGFQMAWEAQAADEAERARRGMTRLQALQRINSAANSTLDLDQTLATTATAVAQEMGTDLCSIFLFEEVTRELELRATSGPFPTNGRHFTLALGEGHTGWVAERGHPLLVADALADARFADEARAYPEPSRSVLAVPIIFFTVEKLEGVISVESRTPRVFAPEEVGFLEIVAGQLAMSIENGRLYEQTDEELRRKVHELSTLHHVSAMVASTLVFDNVLKTIVAQAVQLSGADRSVLFELDPATEQLHAVASHGFVSAEATRAALRVGECCAGIVVQTGEPRMHVDCMRTERGCFLFDHPEAIDDQHSVLCVPLASRRGPQGALCIFSSQRHVLNTHQLQLVMTFANVAAIAMENARLFEETREGLRTKEVLLREMHHRVKNNLQQVASILSMQRRRAKLPEVEQILAESVDRIQGIAATHDLLSNAEPGVARVDEIARKIAGIVRSNLVPPHLRLHFHIGAIPYHVPSEQATTIAIILNELIANAIEHGFESRAEGIIQISGSRVDDHIVLRVADNGGSLPADFSVQENEGLGLQLVRSLVQSDLHGAVELFQAPDPPDIGDSGEHLTDPALATVSAAEASAAAHDAGATGDRQWTVVQLSFPASLASETQRAIFHMPGEVAERA